ncbi:MAG: GNAT family N-acetyltransferase [Bacteroidota bacterium]
MSLRYHITKFEDLNLHLLYQILRLRQEVFVVEQDCAYLDADGLDEQSYHVIGIDPNDTVQAYARVLPAGHSYPEYASIGRVVTSPAYRGQGEGLRTMQRSLALARSLDWTPIKLSAQVYAIPFYEQLGFRSVGDEYLEDGIPHIGMIIDW